MKTLLSSSAVLAGLAAVAFVSLTPRTAQTYPQGAPAGFAGDITDAGFGVRTCATSGCHSSYPLNSGTGSVRVSVSANVQPGQTVPVTVTVVNTTPRAAGATTGHYQGFEAVAKDAAGNLAGTPTLTDAANTRLAGDGAEPYVTHRQAGTSRSSWTFDWTAPDAPATVTFFAAGNAANGGDLPTEPFNNAAGDYVYTTTATVRVGATSGEAAPASALRLALSAPHPNPVRTGRAALRLTLPAAGTVRVRVVDGQGRTVRTVPTTPRTAGESDVMVSTDGLAPGLYFVVAEAGGRRAVQPLSVAR